MYVKKVVEIQVNMSFLIKNCIARSVFRSNLLRANAALSLGQRNNAAAPIPGKPKKLFTPGPLMVTSRVKSAMMADIGTRHSDFEYVIKYVRSAVLGVAGVGADEYSAVLVQGSGTFANESAISSIFSKSSGKVVVMQNGTYGRRMNDICALVGVRTISIPMDLDKLQQTLAQNKDITGVVMVHCETSSGVINPVAAAGKIIKSHNENISFVVDGMTSLGGLPVDLSDIDIMTSSACKCLQGVPGISLVIAKRDAIEKCRYRSNSMVLDIAPQHDSFENNGQFLFTPPTHVMLAFREALLEFEEEGSMEGRSKRYRENWNLLTKEMADIGFKQLLDNREHPDSFIVTTFKYPKNPRFIFDEFYHKLSCSGHVICPRRTNYPNSFRISTIGDLHAEDVHSLINSIRGVCADMRINLPLVEGSMQ